MIMSMQDPIADMLARIRNAQMAEKTVVSMPSSKTKVAIANVLKQEGFVSTVDVNDTSGKAQLSIGLKYHEGRAVIEEIHRASRPGLRLYSNAKNMPRVLGGFGTALVSTSKGLMTDKKAREEGIGGELLCYIW